MCLDNFPQGCQQHLMGKGYYTEWKKAIKKLINDSTLHEALKGVEFTESRMVIAWSSLSGNGKFYLIAVEFQFGKLEMFCQW